MKLRAPRVTICLLLMVVCAGCGSVIESLPARTLAPIAAGTTAYHSYGDSITQGSGLSSPSQAYPVLLAAAKGLTLSNRSVSGDQACDIPTRQIFRNGESPSGTIFPLYTLMIGTNDSNIKGAGAYEDVFNLCQRAAIGWLAMPVDDKVLATAGQVVTTGPGMLENANGWNAWQTATMNSAVMFPITLATPGPIYIWRRIVDGDPGTYSVSVDGVGQGTFTTSTGTPIATQNQTGDSLAFARISTVPAGQHSVTFTQTSVLGTMRIVAIGAPPGATAKVPTVVVGDVPLQLVGGGSSCDVHPAICASYNADVQANILLFANDGLDVRYAENHGYMHGLAREMSDPLHPNALGQSELQSAFQAWIP